MRGQASLALGARVAPGSGALAPRTVGLADGDTRQMQQRMESSPGKSDERGATRRPSQDGLLL